MDINIEQLNTVPVGRIYGTYACPHCGKHTTNARVLFGAGAIEGLPKMMENVAPRGSAVTLVYDRNAETAFVATRRALNAGGLYSKVVALAAEPTVYEAEKIPFPEDTRALVAVGGGTVVDLAKYAAHFEKIPVYVVYTGCDCSALAPSSLLFCKGAPMRYSVDVPQGLVCDPALLPDDPARAAATLGSVLATLSACVDRTIVHLVYGDRLCPAILEQAFATVSETLESMRLNPARQYKGILAQAAIRIGQLTALMGDSSLVAGSALDATLALDMLYNKEGFARRLQGETSVLLSRLLLRLYTATFSSHPARGFYPPPDNNARSALLEKFLGLYTVDAVRRVAPIDLDLKRTAFAVQTVKNDVLDAIADADKLLERGYAVFKRLYPDYGFGLLGAIDPDDCKLAVALAPDLGLKRNTLTLLKSLGVLEVYLD